MQIVCKLKGCLQVIILKVVILLVIPARLARLPRADTTAARDRAVSWQTTRQPQVAI